MDVVRCGHLTFKPNIYRPKSSDLFRKKTKTDREVDITWGACPGYICNAVGAQRQYLLLRGNGKPIPADEPLWQWSNGQIVTVNSVMWVLKGL